MANDMETLARALIASGQGAKLAKGMEKLTALTGTQEGQELMALLAGGGSDAVKQAAQAAMTGDRDAAKNALTALFSTKEGAALAVRLMEIFSK